MQHHSQCSVSGASSRVPAVCNWVKQPLTAGTHSQQAMCSIKSQKLHTWWPAKVAHLMANSSVRQLATVGCSSDTLSSTPVSPSDTWMTCKRCKQMFSDLENSSTSCKHHPALYSGGEVAKAIGFVRASHAPEHQLQQVVGRKGLMRFWDCCGSEVEVAPGCCTGFHISFDDDLNQAKGWN
eukprot:GHRR01019077.1.p1 GENE.GHRR01019077.1~~GHRR01019077.1.p1  ORF type:complete len:181 (+),score=47.90 GHRR01019077.1:64-606(+)